MRGLLLTIAGGAASVALLENASAVALESAAPPLAPSADLPAPEAIETRGRRRGHYRVRRGHGHAYGRHRRRAPRGRAYGWRRNRL